MNWFVYVLECSDKSLYTGITTDITRREKEHNEGKKGAKAIRGKRPVKMVYYEEYATSSDAKKREAAIKRLKREEKVQLITGR